jgi:hypothetical protein
MPLFRLQAVGTGTYNYRSLGLKKIRRLNMSRGGREGNNALVKDQDRYSHDQVTYDDTLNLAKRVMEWECPMGMINELILGRDPILPLHNVRSINQSRGTLSHLSSSFKHFILDSLHSFVLSLIPEGDRRRHSRCEGG